MEMILLFLFLLLIFCSLIYLIYLIIELKNSLQSFNEKSLPPPPLLLKKKSSKVMKKKCVNFPDSGYQLNSSLSHHFNIKINEKQLNEGINSLLPVSYSHQVDSTDTLLVNQDTSQITSQDIINKDTNTSVIDVEEKKDDQNNSNNIDQTKYLNNINDSTPLSNDDKTITQNSISNENINDQTYGYIFLLFGDITEICCDCWLGSAGARLDVRNMPFFPENSEQITVAASSGTLDGLSKIVTYSPWPDNLPIPYTINLKSRRTTEMFVNDTERYIRIAASRLHGLGNRAKLRKNICPLIATPLIGTGFG